MKKQNWLPKIAWNFYPNNDQYFTRKEEQFHVKQYNKQIRQHFKRLINTLSSDKELY